MRQQFLASSRTATYYSELIFVSLPFEFFQKRGPHKVGDANEFKPRCALNLRNMAFGMRASMKCCRQP